MKSRKWKPLAPWLALILLLLIPLCAVSGALIIRTGLFDLQDRSIDSKEISALWALIAAGIATAGTVVGLLLSKSYNDRTLERTTLDTVVKGLELLVNDDGTYAKKAKIAGALAALVHLGHPIIAMRALSAAWAEKAVDSGTACWLISEVFRGNSTESQGEAASLLLEHADELILGEPGRADWPTAVADDWPQHLSPDVRLFTLYSLIQLLTSRTKEWWGTESNWMILVMDEARLNDKEAYIRDFAARALKPLVAIYPEEEVWWEWKGRTKKLSHIRTELSSFASQMEVTQQELLYLNRIAAWAEAGDIRTDFH